MTNKQLAVVLSYLLSLSLPTAAILCCCNFNLATLKTSYAGKNMLPVILGNSEGCDTYHEGYIHQFQAEPARRIHQ